MLRDTSMSPGLEQHFIITRRGMWDRRELREDTFFGNKNDDAHEHVERVLDIVSLFNILIVSHDAVMLHVFPITLTGATKRWVDRLSPGIVNSWDLIKKAFIQRYCPPSKTAKQLEEICNFKQEGDETLYQAWERRNKESSSNSERIAAVVNNLENVGRDMTKLKENVYAIQVGCENCGGAHLYKDCSLKEEVKSIEEAKYGEFGRPSPFSNGAKYRVGPPGYYTRMDNHPPVGEKRPSLEELMNKHLEESTRKRNEMEEWVKKIQENTEINTRNQVDSLKNLETQIKQLTKEFHTKAANETNSPSLDQCKAVYADKKTSLDNGRHEISIASNKCTQIVLINNVSPKILPYQLPPKELNTGNFTLPYTIGSLKFYAMADLGANEFFRVAIRNHDSFDVDNPFDSIFVCMNLLVLVWNMLLDSFPYLDYSKLVHLYLCFNLARAIDLSWRVVGSVWMHPRYAKDQENLNPRPKDYPFKDWLLTKVGHTNVSEPVKKSLLKIWLIDYFQEDIVKDPRERSFDDYKWMFDLEIDKLADEYELGIENKGNMLDDIWENCRKVQGDSTYWWYDQKSEEEERRKLRINIEEYDPPMVHVETFEVK
ncbi:reverse transcriptase domain-containing protein [Tanacetum coccineum]